MTSLGDLSELSKEDLLARIAELEEVQHKSQVDGRIAQFSEDWKEHPALLKVIREIMLSDDGGPALLLSEEGSDSDEPEKLTATDIVERLMAVVPKPSVKLSEQGQQMLGEEVHPADRDDKGTVQERADAARKAMGLDPKRLPRAD
jgi:hypothetical protein